MKQRHIIALVLIATWLPTTSVVNGQGSGMKNPLSDFLSRLSDSEALVTIKTITTISDGPETVSEEFFRVQGELGIFSKSENETERRWIWNQDYAALLETPVQGDWMLKEVMRANADSYATVIKSASVRGCFISGPVLERMKGLALSDVENQAEGSLFEYHFVPESPFFSSDPTLNSMSIRFDGTSEKARLLKINFWQSKDMEITIEYDYPKAALFPLKRTMVGRSKGSTVKRETKVESDRETQFDRSECYLSYYGLPEPKYARKSNRWIWISLTALLVFGTGAFLWNRKANSQ